MINKKFQKNILRERYGHLRKGVLESEKTIKDEEIAKNFLSTMAYKYAGQVLLYSALKGEISTASIFENAIKDNKKCFFPCCLNNFEMEFFAVSDAKDLKQGKFNIPEPLVSYPAYKTRYTDVCVIPAFCYDKHGYRLGYGRGYYDRFLTHFKGIKVGLCYFDFIYKALPKNHHDIAVDILITEKGLFKLRTKL